MLFIPDMSFQCLGSWPGEDGQTYMSLLDTKLPQLGEEPRPRYRCAVSTYKKKHVMHMCAFLSRSLFGTLSPHN